MTCSSPACSTSGRTPPSSTSLGVLPVLKARMNADLHMADDLVNTGTGNLFVIFGEPDIEIRPADGDDPKPSRIHVRINGVDVFHPSTAEVRSDGPDGIACWFIDTDYNGESFFVRQAYFLGANDPYRALTEDPEGGDRHRRLGVAAPRHVAAARVAGVASHRRHRHRPPRRRGDEGVRIAAQADCGSRAREPKIPPGRSKRRGRWQSGTTPRSRRR